MKIPKIRIVQSGYAVIPKGYGVSHIDLACDRIHCYPIPLHFIVWLFLGLWRWFKIPLMGISNWPFRLRRPKSSPEFDRR